MKRLPTSLQYRLPEPAPEVDPARIAYNSYYRSYDFAARKFPRGFMLPGLIEACIPRQTPLEEIEERRNNINTENERQPADTD